MKKQKIFVIRFQFTFNLKLILILFNCPTRTKHLRKTTASVFDDIVDTNENGDVVDGVVSKKKHDKYTYFVWYLACIVMLSMKQLTLILKSSRLGKF